MDRAWEVIQKLSPSWCDKPCGVREGCGCADEIERALNRERDACRGAALKAVTNSAEHTLVAVADAINGRIDYSV